MNAPRTLDAMWREFAEMTLDPRSSKTQVEDTETAFKAGAASVLTETFNVVSKLPDADGIEVLMAWTREAKAHFAKYGSTFTQGDISQYD
jgi:hypothetical protein